MNQGELFTTLAAGGYAPSTFNAEAGERAKKVGKDRAAKKKNPLLLKAREFARQIAREKGEVNMDDVQLALVAAGHSVRALGNAAGKVFAGSEWVDTGRFVKSKRVHAHSNKISVWRLRDQ